MMGIICVIAEAAHLVLHTGEGKILYGILFIVMEAAAAFLLITGRRTLGGLSWRREEQEEQEEPEDQDGPV